MKWGNAQITSKAANESGKLELHCNLKLEDKNYKKTTKLTWIIEDPSNLEIEMVELDHLITKRKLEGDEKLEDIVNTESCIRYKAIAEGAVSSLKSGDVL